MPKSSDPTKFYLASCGPGDVEEVNRPRHDIGDARHFPNGVDERWQLRPLLAEDMIDGFAYEPGTRMLVKHLPYIGALRFTLRLPFRLRRNTRCNAERAYRALSEERPEVPQLVNDLERLSHEFARELHSGKVVVDAA